MRFKSRLFAGSVLAAAFLFFIGPSAPADQTKCSLADYKALPGLTAAQDGESLVLTWDGDKTDQVRMRLAINGGTPTIQEIAVRHKGGSWATLATNVTPEYDIVTGLRRMSNQQLEPLHGLGVQITQEILNKYKWEPFWDAPLDLSAPTAGAGFGGNPPPAEGLPGTDQPGLPRNPNEIHRASAVYQAQSCNVKTDGGRIEVVFPGVELGVFSGDLQFTVYKGTNLIRQEIDAKTTQDSVAYKYDAGLKGMPIGSGSRVAWRDTGGTWQDYQFGGHKNSVEVPLIADNRLVIAEQGSAGSIAAFPTPHTFFWSREVAINMGYNWYRKDSDSTFSFGIRQNEKEDASQGQGNWALYSARPGTTQRMAMYIYPNAGPATATAHLALALTHNDHYKPLPGYQVMNHHYHMDLGQRLLDSGSLNTLIPDLEVLKALGVNIVSQIDSVMGLGPVPAPGAASSQGAAAAAGRGAAAAGGRGGRGGRGGPSQVEITAASVEGARIHSDKGFLIMPDQEVFGSPLGGHTDLLFSHPVYWDNRKPGQPFVENDPKYGKVYYVADANDFMEMAKREDILISMPHPRTKGSTGYPDAVKDTDFFNDPHYQGIGFRWGMGLDGSEVRLCEYRCLPLVDDMNNWVADKPIPPKYFISISEVRHQTPGDDVYESSPVTYVKLDALPSPEDVSPVVKALFRGDSFVTSGEVLIPSYSVQGTGNQRTIVADVEWTYPLDMVEVVWGDGQHTDRKVISTKELPPFGSHHFEIPFDVTGKKWVRFAAWDSAGNGAMEEPIKLPSAAQPK
jgi:hypothetical protein